MSHWPEGYGRRILETVDSTNAEGLRLAGELAGPEWIMARRQTAARGRRGRAWASPEGAFAATLVMRCTEPPAQMALRSFAAALALRDAVLAVTGGLGALALKWPNDVLLNGGKLAGILLESGPGGVLAIGIGVNLEGVPDTAGLEPRALAPVSLRGETAVAVGQEAFLDHLAAAYAPWEQRFRDYGFAPLRRAWLEDAARLGQEVTARTGQAEVTGRFETLDEDGRLVLATDGGRQAIAAADVYF